MSDSIHHAYTSKDEIRRLAHSLRDEKTLFYQISDPNGCLAHNNSFESLPDALYALSDSMYRHQITGLELFDVGCFQFYQSSGTIYVSMVVALPPETMCSTFFINDPDEYEDEDEKDDLDTLTDSDEFASKRIQKLLKLLDHPYPEHIEETSSTRTGDDTIYLHRITDDIFHQLKLTTVDI